MKVIFDFVYAIGDLFAWGLIYLEKLPVELRIIVIILILFLVWQGLGFVGELFRPKLNSSNKRYAGKIRTWGNPQTEYEKFHR